MAAVQPSRRAALVRAITCAGLVALALLALGARPTHGALERLCASALPSVRTRTLRACSLAARRSGLHKQGTVADGRGRALLAGWWFSVAHRCVDRVVLVRRACTLAHRGGRALTRRRLRFATSSDTTCHFSVAAYGGATQDYTDHFLVCGTNTNMLVRVKGVDFTFAPAIPGACAGGTRA